MKDIPFSQLPKNKFDEKDRTEIEGWQRRAIELAAQEDYRNHPVTVELATLARNEIVQINAQLSEMEDLPESKRTALFREKKVHQFYLKLFERDPGPELESIEQKVQNVIEINS